MDLNIPLVNDSLVEEHAHSYQRYSNNSNLKQYKLMNKWKN